MEYPVDNFVGEQCFLEIETSLRTRPSFLGVSQEGCSAGLSTVGLSRPRASQVFLEKLHENHRNTAKRQSLEVFGFAGRLTFRKEGFACGGHVTPWIC